MVLTSSHIKITLRTGQVGQVRSILRDLPPNSVTVGVRDGVAVGVLRRREAGPAGDKPASRFIQSRRTAGRCHAAISHAAVGADRYTKARGALFLIPESARRIVSVGGPATRIGARLGAHRFAFGLRRRRRGRRRSRSDYHRRGFTHRPHDRRRDDVGADDRRRPHHGRRLHHDLLRRRPRQLLGGWLSTEGAPRTVRTTGGARTLVRTIGGGDSTGGGAITHSSGGGGGSSSGGGGSSVTSNVLRSWATCFTTL